MRGPRFSRPTEYIVVVEWVRAKNLHNAAIRILIQERPDLENQAFRIDEAISLRLLLHLLWWWLWW